jgi:hypothetical protein
MAIKRHNIDTIAEVLIDKLNDMERTAQRIETASTRELKIDSKELRTLLENQKREEKTFLDDLRAVGDKNSTRVPNWVWGVIGSLTLCSLGFIFYAWNKAEAYDLQKQKAEYFEQEYNNLKK